MGNEAPLLSRTLGGRFKITGHIGEGAMASVFRGVDLQNPGSGEIAVKIMHPHLASDRTFTARFKREAQAASMVKHPNSVQILDLGEEAGVHYIVMELCAGRDLRETLKAERRLPEPRAVRIIMTICDALSVAHGLNIVHRDLKPENVMIQHDKESGTDLVKVLDFGIAKLVDAQPKVRVNASDSDPPPALTQFGVVVGTPQYMSPEQCRGHPLDGRSDVYTCGILLYQLVTGQLPFNSDSPFEVAGKQAFEAPPPPHTHFAAIDPELEAIILRTLSKAADDRPQSASALMELLGAWLEKAGSRPAAAAPVPIAPVPPEAPKPPAPPAPSPGLMPPPGMQSPGLMPPPGMQSPGLMPPPGMQSPGLMPPPGMQSPGPPRPPPPPARPAPPGAAPIAAAPVIADKPAPSPALNPQLAASLANLQRTMPLNEGGNTIGNMVEQIIKRGGPSGPFAPAAPVAAAAIANEYSNYDAQGPLGTIVAMEAITEPPKPRPPVNAGPINAGPMNAPLPAPAPLPQDLAPPQDLHEPDRQSPDASFGQAPQQFGNVSAAQPMGLTPEPQQAPQLAFQAPAAITPPSQEQGWGAFGVMMIILSVCIGIAMGIGLYEWAPF